MGRHGPKKVTGRVQLRHEHMFALKDVSENEDTGTKGLVVEDTEDREREREGDKE